jgi:hypothetical protein
MFTNQATIDEKDSGIEFLGRKNKRAVWRVN